MRRGHQAAFGSSILNLQQPYISSDKGRASVECSCRVQIRFWMGQTHLTLHSWLWETLLGMQWTPLHDLPVHCVHSNLMQKDLQCDRLQAAMQESDYTHHQS